MFEVENKFYEEHIKEFREKYLGKHIVIKGNELKGIYNSDEEAINESIKTMELGTFAVKIVSNNDEDTNWRFYSRVNF